jgi:uncharacterized protein YjiS (DUF1127 family)
MATNILPLPSAARPAASSGIVAAAVRRVVAVARTLRRRHELGMLASVDDRMLADIGLTRGDLRDAVAEPPWRDPTAVLVARVQERRHARRMLLLPAPPAATVRDHAAPPLVPQAEDLSSELFPARSRYY